MPLPPESPAEKRLAVCPIIDPALLAPAPRLKPAAAGEDARIGWGAARSAYGALSDRYDELVAQATAKR